MRKTLSRFSTLSIALLLALTMVLSMSCLTYAVADEVDNSEFAPLKMFAIIYGPNDQKKADEYFEQFNAMLKEKINASVEVVYASGNDYQNNYQLALASGEQYDMIHSGQWLNYSVNAAKGAFMPLDDLIQKYAPTVWERGADRWAGVKVNGQIFGVPRLADTYTENAFIYREDLRLKYNCPELKSFADIETYLQAIKDNEPEMLPSDDYGVSVYGNSFIPTTKYLIVDNMNDKNSNFVIDPANPRKVLCTVDLPEYLPYMHMMHDWQSRGFWPTSVLNSLEPGPNMVHSGKAAAAFGAQFPNYTFEIPITEATHPDWKINEVLFVNFVDDSCVVGNSPASDMISITRNAKYPERAMKFIELMHTDEEVYRMANYGIEGVHYQVTDGKRDRSFLTDLATEDFNYFPGEFFRDSNYHLRDIDEWEGNAALEATLDARKQPNVLLGYSFDPTPFEAQYVAINQLRLELGQPMQAGLVDDVDAAYADYVQRLKDAGLEEVRQKIEDQINAFLDASGK